MGAAAVRHRHHHPHAPSLLEGARGRGAARGAEPPNPFDPANPEAFVGWLNEPSDDGPRTLSRYLYSIYLDRADLQVHFRDIHGADAVAFVDWLWQGGIAPETIPLELLPSVPPAENRGATGCRAAARAGRTPGGRARSGDGRG